MFSVQTTLILLNYIIINCIYILVVMYSFGNPNKSLKCVLLFHSAVSSLTKMLGLLQNKINRFFHYSTWLLRG